MLSEREREKTGRMVPPAVIAGESQFMNQQSPFYGYMNPQGVMGMPPFAAFNNPYVNAAFNQQNVMNLSPHGKPAQKPTVPTPMTPSVEQRPLSEKESKELKRKKANRESARRSKLRKKEEFESLAKKVDILQAKGVSLRTEIAKMEGVLETLSSQNQSLKKEALQIFGNLKCIESLENNQNHLVSKSEKKGSTEHQNKESEGQSTSTITSEDSDGTNDIQGRPSNSEQEGQKKGENMRLDSGCESDDANCTISIKNIVQSGAKTRQKRGASG